MKSVVTGDNNTNKKGTYFEVYVSKDTFKFNAAHFVTFQGFRERLHGHNYKVSVRLCGSHRIGRDGYVIDFGDVKAVTKKICKELNEHFLCPMLSDVMTIEITKNNNAVNENSSSGNAETIKKETVTLTCEDGSVFVFPRDDCFFLPIVHATTEELAIYLWGKILSGLDASILLDRGIHTLEVIVAEAIGQEATFRYEIPQEAITNPNFSLDVRSFLNSGTIQPMPCLPVTTTSSASTTTTTNHSITTCCDGNCQASKIKFEAQLQRIADGINDGTLFLAQKEKNNNNNNNKNGITQITVDDIEQLIRNKV